MLFAFAALTSFAHAPVRPASRSLSHPYYAPDRNSCHQLPRICRHRPPRPPARHPTRLTPPRPKSSSKSKASSSSTPTARKSNTCPSKLKASCNTSSASSRKPSSGPMSAWSAPIKTAQAKIRLHESDLTTELRPERRLVVVESNTHRRDPLFTQRSAHPRRAGADRKPPPAALPSKPSCRRAPQKSAANGRSPKPPSPACSASKPSASKTSPARSTR